MPRNENMPLKLIGYWCTPEESGRWPHPRRLVSRWEPGVQASIVDYLRRGAICTAYRGSSYCRFGCGGNGSTERTDGVFAWPDGLSHYIDVHSVRLPAPFIEHAEMRGFSIARELHDDWGGDPDYDLTLWSDWCRVEAPPRWTDWLYRWIDERRRDAHDERLSPDALRRVAWTSSRSSTSLPRGKRSGP